MEAGRKKMRNVCLVGGPNSAKSYIFKPLSLIFKTYTRPDGGSYQLAVILDKEIVFLNDFEYDDDAKKWCAWQYFKRFLEGEALTVACPKNRGGNQEFKSSAPVFITAPQEIALYRGKKKDAYETDQMDKRVKYIHLPYGIPQESLREVDPCAHCGARLYLEGSTGYVMPSPCTPPSSSSGVKRDASQVSGVGSQPLVSDGVLQKLKEVHSLKASGLLDTPESKRLKDQILSDLACSKKHVHHRSSRALAGLFDRIGREPAQPRLTQSASYCAWGVGRSAPTAQSVD